MKEVHTTTATAHEWFACALTFVCTVNQDELKLRCLKRSCKQKGHMLCWAQRFLRDQPEVLLPTTGTCPSCQTALSWPEMLNG
jgi:structure-specific endonuclease subunit SLX1